MANKLDHRPVFIIVMGCNGVGKSAWKRFHYHRLPQHYFDLDTIAGGIGDWNSDDARIRTSQFVEPEINRAIRERLSYGVESAYSGRPERERVEQARQAGYRIEGIFLGTASPAINIARIERRVLEHTGHRVDPFLVPERYQWSLSNLRRMVQQFDQLEIIDNSRDNPLGIPQPIEQCRLEHGKVIARCPPDEMATWCIDWLARLEQSHAEEQHRTPIEP